MSLGFGRVLIIEDDPAVAEVLSFAMERGGAAEIAIATDGLAGLQKARAWEPDLILCDVMLPGMSGLELTRALFTSDPPATSKVVFVTGAANLAFRGQSPTDWGAVGAISKPVDVLKLPDMLREILAQAR